MKYNIKSKIPKFTKTKANFIRTYSFSLFHFSQNSTTKKSTLSKDQLNFFNANGYLVLKDYFSKEKVNTLKQEMHQLVSKQNPTELTDTFKAGKNFLSRYFLESGDKIRFFLEPDVFLATGGLKYPLAECINKVGHGLHDLNPVFRQFSYSSEVTGILNDLGYQNPAIVQSMYIMKSKRIGGEVTPHTDNSYIRTQPASCVGIWVALDRATKANGALFGVPGSHKQKTDYFMRLVKKDKESKSTGSGEYEMQTEYSSKVPPKYILDGAVSLEADQGTAVLLHGDFVHFSHQNSSDAERHAYTLHCVETKNTQWCDDNWLQRPKDNPFKVIKF